jgi:hypothetical protein
LGLSGSSEDISGIDTAYENVHYLVDAIKQGNG